MYQTIDKTFWIENYGCQMNRAEANAISNELSAVGWLEAPAEDNAEAVILNSCAIRLTAENKLWSRLTHFQIMKQKRDFTLIVIGCVAERLQQEIPKRYPGVDYVIGSMAKDGIAALLTGKPLSGQTSFLETEVQTRRTGRNQPKLPQPKVILKDEYLFFSNHSDPKSVDGFIPIMQGCNNFCSYCIVPFVRGKEVSRPAAEVLQEAQQQEALGYQDITLISQNVNSYSHGGQNFNDLLRLLTAETGIPWIRFITPHPSDFDDEFIELIATNPRICNHVHLPLQHSADRLLESMNRGYTIDWYRSLVLRLRRAVPEISLTTDLILGFPGEEEADVRHLLDYLEEVRYDSAFIYYYNPIPGTPAAELEQVPLELQKERLYRAQAAQDRITAENMQHRIGKTEEVLVRNLAKDCEDKVYGRNQFNHLVRFPGDASLINRFVRVQTTELKGNRTLWGPRTEAIDRSELTFC